jgi:outer membrane protein
MLFLRFSFILLLFGSLTMVKAQNRWSLQKCVTYATENSLAIKQSIAQIRNAELTLKQNQLSRLPNLNAGVSGGYQFGRTIDPTTNSFALEGIGFNSYSLSTGIQVFGGGIIKHNILRSKYELEAGKLEAEATENNLGLQVAAAYLNVLLADEQLVIAKTRLLQSQNQLNQINRFIEVGARPINERYDFEAALALDQQALIEAENFLIRSNLILRQFLLIPDGTPFDIEKPEIKVPEDVDVDVISANELFVGAVDILPQVKAAEKRLQAANIGILQAKANLLPTLSLFASLRSNFSNQARTITGFDVTKVKQNVFINNIPVALEIEQNVPTFAKKAYFDQVSENFGQSLGLQLNIPIYNNRQVKINIERAKLGVISNEVAKEQARQQLRTEIEQTLTAVRASQRTLQAANLSLKAATAAFENAQKRYELGAINSLELNTARTNMERAKSDRIRSRFQHLFNLKQVDFYQGRPITLD